MGCRELEIQDYFHFVGTNPMPKKPHSRVRNSACTKKNAYSRFSHTVISNYRYYSAELGRWLSRDPIGERGGYNLYGIVDNNPVDIWDFLGYLKGPLKIVSKYKSAKRNDIGFYVADKTPVCEWEVSSKLGIIYKSKTDITVYPKSVSTSINDSYIIAYTNKEKTEFEMILITIIKSYSVARIITFRDKSHPLLISTRYRWTGFYKIFDQFKQPFPAGVTVGEKATVTAYQGTYGKPPLQQGSDITNSLGIVQDNYQATFRLGNSTGFLSIKQDVIIGDYKATYVHMMTPGKFYGFNNVAKFK